MLHFIFKCEETHFWREWLKTQRCPRYENEPCMSTICQYLLESRWKLGLMKSCKRYWGDHQCDRNSACLCSSTQWLLSFSCTCRKQNKLRSLQRLLWHRWADQSSWCPHRGLSRNEMIRPISLRFILIGTAHKRHSTHIQRLAWPHLWLSDRRGEQQYIWHYGLPLLQSSFAQLFFPKSHQIPECP